jgi:Spy/CpxP family protein refolding chaperone
MNTGKIVSALALAALVGAAGTLATQPATAQATTVPQQAQREGHHFSPTRHIEGRIAYLKAELKITDAQAPQFAPVAEAMRDNAKTMGQAIEQRRAERGQPQSAVQRLETRAQLAALRADDSRRFLEAFKPLYASLSDDQKKAADELLSRHLHR